MRRYTVRIRNEFRIKHRMRPGHGIGDGWRPPSARAFEDDLMAVSTLTARMGGRAEDLLAQALTAIDRRDADLAEEIARGDAAMDELERQLSERAVAVLALRNPVAGDLRMLLASLRISASLERVGNLARNTAVRGAALRDRRRDELSESILRLGERAQAQLSEALSAHQARDADRARAIARRERQLDAHFASVAEALVARMAEEPKDIGSGAQWLFVAKNLERAGDHAVSIAEATWFMVRGEALDPAA